MEATLEILVSTKGTKVVTATALHQVLELTDHHFPANTRRWVKDVYQFEDGIRRAVVMKDYAPRKIKDTPLIEDYYLSLELAKLIALHSRSRNKLKVARLLQEQEESGNTSSLLSTEEILQVMELAKAMTMRSCQEAAERRHAQIYQRRNAGSAANWWQHRQSVLGYSLEELRHRALVQGVGSKGKSFRQLLLKLDPLELIRVGVIDHLMALGKPQQYACNLGNVAKTLAQELDLEIYDDLLGGNIFAPQVDSNLVQQVVGQQQMERA